jgi:hypothetical protein
MGMTFPSARRESNLFSFDPSGFDRPQSPPPGHDHWHRGRVHEIYRVPDPGQTPWNFLQAVFRLTEQTRARNGGGRLPITL